ncbi:hypothetical protein L596_008430 [Steinernema carpocapsae]|uniref:Protein kinase domain-containing protein n=1 Tax=Steinernema carpocapsae TaxID=34508 RepID=A0A4U5PCG8_STECR|nr:hypothetical protein L596_008430 [Steinernema carpocapsae]
MADSELFTAALRFAESLPSQTEQFGYLVDQAKWCDRSSLDVYNNNCVKKLVTHITSHFSRTDEFKSDERLIDVYGLLGKTSRTMGQKKVFKQVYQMGNLKKSAKFYIKWAAAHASDGEMTKVEEIYKLAMDNEAEPQKDINIGFAPFMPRLGQQEKADDTMMLLATTHRDDFTFSQPSAPVVQDPAAANEHQMEVDQEENMPPPAVPNNRKRRQSSRMTMPLAAISEASMENVQEPCNVVSGNVQDACNAFSYTLPLSQEAKASAAKEAADAAAAAAEKEAAEAAARKAAEADARDAAEAAAAKEAAAAAATSKKAPFEVFYDPETPAVTQNIAPAPRAAFAIAQMPARGDSNRPGFGFVTSTPFAGASNQPTTQAPFLLDESAIQGDSNNGLFGGASPVVMDESSADDVDEDEPTGVGLNTTILGDLDPWDKALRMKVLNATPAPDCRKDFLTTKCQTIAAGKTVTLGEEQYEIRSLIGQGGFAKVFKVKKNDSRKEMALKYESPACAWEIYMCETARSRLQSEITDFVMFVNESYVFNNASAIVYEYYPHGTLLDVSNKYKHENAEMSHVIVMIVGFQIASILKSVHESKLIHGDVKPDNFVITGPIDEQLLADPMSRPVVKLIDWGRGIDMRQFEGKRFRGKAGTEQFDCPEMLDGREWTYQTDFFGFIAVVYVLCVGEYISTHKQNGRYTVTKQLKRRFGCRQMWIEIMDMILNIPSCYQLPEWNVIIKLMQSQFRESISADDLDCRKALERFNKLISN